MTALTVIGGYLGAGKTTLLNHLLATCDDRRLGVLVNDFGAINIDASLIVARSDSRINLTNGCICCSMADGFHEALEQLLLNLPAPDHIVVEASGVADISLLAEYGRVPGMQLDGVLVVADAETLQDKVNDRYVGTTVRRQLAAADLLLLNKVDLVSAGTLRARREWLQSTYPQVRVITCQQARLPVDLLLGVNTTRVRVPAIDAGHEHYVSWHVNLDSPVSRTALESFAEQLDSAVLRAKGTVGAAGGTGLVFQRVGRRWEITDAAVLLPAGTQIVAIGLKDQLDLAQLDRIAAMSFGPAP